MADLQRSTSPPNSTNLSVPEDEGILEKDRSVGRSDGAARASADAAPTSAPDGIDNENEAASSQPQKTSTSRHNAPHRPPPRETFFGMPQPSGAHANFQSSYDDDNYETRFPPDPIYEEVTSPNARVYRVYMEESAKYDAYMTDEAREGLDVLLVFAGLFSAVLTTLVAQTSQSLQPDRATETTLLLREVASLQRAQINGTSIDSIPSTPADFTPSAIDVWVNGLWFTSLTLSLASALFAVLIKQWIRHYTSFVSGTAQERSLIRQYRFMGLEKWHVPTLIGVLPVLMHLSLAIFFVGLTLFLIPLRPSIASIVGSLSTLVFVAYVTTAAWPLFRIQCPYHTPLSTIIHDITFTLCKYMLRRHLDYVCLKEQERQAPRLDEALVTHSFEWLLNMSSNPSVLRVVTQAVGGLLYKSSLIGELVQDNQSFRVAWRSMFDGSIRQSVDDAYIRPEKVDLLEQLFRSTLHSPPFLFSMLFDSAISTAIQSFPAPTLQWESTATAFLWHHRYILFNDTTLAYKACTVIHHLISDTREKETRLPVIVWEDLLAAASSCPGILLHDPSDPPLHKKITHELEHRVRSERWPLWWPLGDNNTLPISFEEVLSSENFVWFFLSPFDPYKGSPLDSEKVQRLLSLVYAILSRGLRDVTPELFIGTCQGLIWELQAGSVTRDDQEAVCGAMDALLQERITFHDNFGTDAVLLPSLILLHYWPGRPHIPLRSVRKDILLGLIEIDMFHTLRDKILDSPWTYTGPVAFLTASIIRTSFELRMDPGAQAEDSQWLEYLSLPENTPTIVSMFTFQGTMDTPASVAKVRDDLLFFFSSQSMDCETLRQCRTSMESHLQGFEFEDWRDTYRDNMKAAGKVIDQFISKQTPKPANPVRRLLRRSRKSPDPEARYPPVKLSPLNMTNMSSN